MQTLLSRKYLLVILLCCLLVLVSACVLRQPEDEREPGRLGDEGRQLAIALAETHPSRLPGSPGEAAAAAFLQQALEARGMQVQRQNFQFLDSQGQQQSSQNLWVHLPGRGLKAREQVEKGRQSQAPSMQPPAVLQGRRLIMGAHYDTGAVLQRPESTDQRLANALPNGLHDNAAAVAAVITAAENILKEQPPYHVDIVLFGAGHAEAAGARHFLASLPPESLPLIDGVMVLEAIYAGDKVYAHAGRNSLRAGTSKDYLLRRKLYEATDIYYENLLLTRNQFALYTNQSLCKVPYGALGEVLYREWSLRDSDYLPFDEAGLPIVFFDSGDYQEDDCSKPFKESKDPYFAETQGVIQGSSLDASAFLLDYFVAPGKARELEPFGGAKEAQEASAEDYGLRTDRLQIRINNLAFILTELAKKTPAGTESR